jgi:hypothetical protein
MERKSDHMILELDFSSGLVNKRPGFTESGRHMVSTFLSKSQPVVKTSPAQADSDLECEPQTTLGFFLSTTFSLEVTLAFKRSKPETFSFPLQLIRKHNSDLDEGSGFFETLKGLSE